MSLRDPVFGLLICLWLGGCAGSAFQSATEEDTVSAYHRFLRDYGDSSYAESAQARLDFARVRARPSRKAFEAFAAKYEANPLLEALRPFVEEHFLRSARSEGTAEAYRDFMEAFPGGTSVARAEGNAVYLEAQGYLGDPVALAHFAEEYPASDYAAEAQRSAAAAQSRQETRFRRAELLIDIDPSTPGADRLRRTFTDRAIKTYAPVGVQLVPVAAAGGDGKAPVRITIKHSEKLVKSEVIAGTVSRSGLLAHTTVTLQRRGQAEPLWHRVFNLRGSGSERNATTSLLFGAGGGSYWQEFFVPIVGWDTSRAAREPHAFREPAVAVEMVGSRVVVLFGDGDFEVFEVSDPASPALLAAYDRPRDLAEFGGVRVLGNRVVVFGADGIEVVRLAPDGPVRESAKGRDVVGSIVAVEGLPGGLVLASQRGLLWLGNDGVVGKILDREVLGLARFGERLLFTDGNSLFAATLDLLKAGRVESELRMGRGFRPARLRASGPHVVVIGERGTAWVDARVPGQLQLVSRIDVLESGAVSDVALLGGRLFILGDRGLQVSDRSGERVVNSVDVGSKYQLSGDGRHQVVVGDAGLQVVDATPFLRSAAATPRR
jgi:hypothetical protein